MCSNCSGDYEYDDTPEETEACTCDDLSVRCPIHDTEFSDEELGI